MSTNHLVAWILQGNPKRFRTLDYLRHSSHLDWRVRAHASRMRPGDRAYIWQSGPSAGVIAIGELEGMPRLLVANSALALQYSAREESELAAVPTLRVPVEVTYLADPILTRREVLHDATLREMTVIASPQATSFGVTELQSQRLDELLQGRLQPL